MRKNAIIFAIIAAGGLRPTGCSCLGQDLDDLTSPQIPPLTITYPAPAPTCGKIVGNGAVSNFLRLVVGPALSQPIAREVHVRRNDDGTATMEIVGQFTQPQIAAVWASIRSQWTMPTNTAGLTPQFISLTPTNSGSYIRIQMQPPGP